MINIFVKLNLNKISLIYKYTSLIFSALFLIFNIINYFTGNTNIQVSTIIIGLLITTTLVPLFFLFLLYIGWKTETLRLKKLFKTKPLDKLENFGFKTTLIDDDNKTVPTLQTKGIIINDFKILIGLISNDSKRISFKTFIEKTEISEEQYNKLQENKISFYETTISKIFDIKDIESMDEKQLLNALHEYISIIKMEKIIPA